jgi:hypothetical protein
MLPSSFELKCAGRRLRGGQPHQMTHIILVTKPCLISEHMVKYGRTFAVSFQFGAPSLRRRAIGLVVKCPARTMNLRSCWDAATYTCSTGTIVIFRAPLVAMAIPGLSFFANQMGPRWWEMAGLRQSTLRPLSISLNKNISKVDESDEFGSGLWLHTACQNR